MPRPSGQRTYPEASLWPGITWGHNALCLCSWSYRFGVAQVKVLSGICTVHLSAPKPPPEDPKPLPDDGLTVEDLLTQVIALLAEALEPEPREGAPCGRRGGYMRHYRAGEDACPECLEAVAADARESRRNRGRKKPRRSGRGTSTKKAA